MDSDTIRVRPRTGLILAGVPSAGADLPKALAEEWIGNRLVVAVEPPTPAARPVAKANRPDRTRRRRSR